MTATVSQINSKVAARQDGIFGNDSLEMIGDLLPEKGGPQTAVGWTVWGILTSSVEVQGLTESQGNLPGPNNAKCNADTCCIWRHIALDMEKKFKGDSGRCTKWARFSIHLGFHDAGTWSKFTDHYGGADGSIILANELGRGENNGLQDVAVVMQKWYD